MTLKVPADASISVTGAACGVAERRYRFDPGSSSEVAESRSGSQLEL
jgi:hypothetical protein